MNDKTVAVSLPPDLYTELASMPMFQGRLKQKLQLSIAVGMFVSKEISLSRAAAYAEISLHDFIELLVSYNIPVVDYTDDMYEDDLSFAIGVKG